MSKITFPEVEVPKGHNLDALRKFFDELTGIVSRLRLGEVHVIQDGFDDDSVRLVFYVSIHQYPVYPDSDPVVCLNFFNNGKVDPWNECEPWSMNRDWESACHRVLQFYKKVFSERETILVKS